MESGTRIVYVGLNSSTGVVRGLRDLGGTVTVVETVADCLTRLSTVSCVVISDTVPDIDPVECCTRIRTRCPDVPIVVVPDNGSETLAGKVIAAGADGYVPRSAGIDTLKTRVCDLLEESPVATTADGSSPTHTSHPRSVPSSERDDKTTNETQSPAEVTLPSGSRMPSVQYGSDLTDPAAGIRNGALGSHAPDGSAAAPAKHLELLVDQSPLAIIEWTLEFAVANWNPAATELFGYTAPAAHGEYGPDLLVPETERETVLEHWEQLTGRELSGSSAWKTSENVRKDGSHITCEWFNTPISDADGDIVSVLSFVQDVTAERKRANTLEALQETTNELIRAESVDEIASIVMDATEHVIDRSLAALRYYNDETHALELAAITADLAGNTGDISAIGPDDRVLWEAYTDGDPFIVEDVNTDRIPYDLDIDVGKAILYPLGDHGMLSVASAGDDTLDVAEINLVHVLAATAEAALDRAEREQELERTKTIVETVGDSVYALDRDGTLVTVNDRLTETTGYDRDELVGKHVSMILSDESLERGRKRVRALRSADENYLATYEISLITRDGDQIPCEVNTTLFRDDDTFEGSVGIIRDVSDRKRMERELVERKSKIEGLHGVASQLDDCESREEIYERTVEAAQDVLNFDVCIVDKVAGDSLVTAALSSTLDGDFDQRMGIDEGITGRTYRTQETHRFDDIRTSTVAAPRDEAFRSGLSVPIGDWGVFQTVSTEVGSFTREDEELAELLLSHVTDALDRIAFEAQLRTERDRFAALFENVPDAVVSARQIDGEAIVESVNPAFERIFGYDETTLVGESLDQFIVPAGRTAEAEAITRRGSNGEIVEAEVKRRTADGLRDFMMRVVPMEMNEPSHHAFTLYTDITDQKQRQKRVEILNRVLRHDMRNGMNIIDGCAEMLADVVDDADAEYASTIQKRASELIGLAEKTRAVERILDRESATTGPINLADTVREAVSRLEDAHPDVEVSSSIPDRLFARADASLQTAIYQVLENAVEHNDSTAPLIEISACDRTDDEMLSVSIADDGPGMPTEERELLQGDQEITQLRHTSGLGLWLVNLVITKSGGQLAFDSNEPRGTVVTLEIPRADTELVRSTGDTTVTGD